ncbi:LysE family translocator [Dyadobacter pollutisoli]|uniref:LysE family translocator n=1 Tax=Dyadobacter pollutisoli TaxID=2910158 RepID=A0A9E8SNA6_9BACT|nr:LysE family translocator [Dyadobacter pollutisoli]WAC13561.1 LysE family translocator [Dyadobacter pollutisoli]
MLSNGYRVKSRGRYGYIGLPDFLKLDDCNNPIIMVSFGLTAVLFAVPLAYTFLKTAGTLYLLYLAYQAVKPGNKGLFEMQADLENDNPAKLFSMGFFTNVLNPKAAVFYLSFFPQFIKPENGSVMGQSLQLGITQILILTGLALKMALDKK